MLETSARLLRLLSLLQTPREWTGGAPGERLGVSPRTVRNDVDKLRELGYPVLATRGAAGGYRLRAGAAGPPLVPCGDAAAASRRRGGRRRRGRAQDRGDGTDRRDRGGLPPGTGQVGAGAALQAADPRRRAALDHHP